MIALWGFARQAEKLGKGIRLRELARADLMLLFGKCRGMETRFKGPFTAKKAINGQSRTLQHLQS